MKIPNNLLISFLVTFAYIILYIWNRIIRIRLPREINYHEVITLQDKITMIICFIYLFLFSYYCLKYLKIIPKPNSKFKKLCEKISGYLESKKIISIFLEYFNKHVLNGPHNIYIYLYNFIYVKPFIWFYAKLLHKYFEMKPVIAYILIFFLPRLLVAIILLTEVIFFNCIDYFYKMLILVMIPLIFNIILYMIKHHSITCLDIFNEYFIFKLINNNDNLEITFKPFDDPIKLQEQQNLLQQAENDWAAYQNMYSISAKINLEKDKYNYMANIIIYGIFVIAFSIYVFKITGVFISIPQTDNESK